MHIVINGIFITFAYQFTRDVFFSPFFHLRSLYVVANAGCPFIIIIVILITITFIIAVYRDALGDIHPLPPALKMHLSFSLFPFQFVINFPANEFDNM